MTDLGSDWIPDGDGIPHREAARVVLFAPDGSILLLHGHDGHDAEHVWWFTVGGGIEGEETPRECAVREVFEETGIELDPTLLVGPVLYRQADFRFRNVHARQDEWFFLATLAQYPRDLDASRRTSMEGELLDGHAWFNSEELEVLGSNEQIYPKVLPQLVKQWQRGWDGKCLNLFES